MADTPSDAQALWGGSSESQPAAAASTPAPEPAPAMEAAAASHAGPAACKPAAGPAELAACCGSEPDAAPAVSEEPPRVPMEGDARPAPRPGLKVMLDLNRVLEHCKCSICMGIIKNTRAVSACMHRFCKECIEAWLRTQMQNNCPHCRVKFSSKRDCKPDPNFDLLLAAMFGNIQDFEKRMLDPSLEVVSLEVVEAAKAVGHQIARAKEQAGMRRPPPPPAPPSTQHPQALQDHSANEQQQQQQQEQQPQVLPQQQQQEQQPQVLP
ncbi:hypothetical protein ABPG75_000006 [Micractinium tetrahymenae]